MKVTMTVTRTFEMDSHRVLIEPTFDPPPTNTPPNKLRRWLQESFYELNGWDRDHDHVDGSYVRLVSETGETEWEWPDEISPANSQGSAE